MAPRQNKLDLENKDFQDQVRNLATKAAKTVVRKASIAPDFTEDEPEDDEEEELDEDTDVNLSLDQEPLAASDRFAQLNQNTRTEAPNSDEGLDVFDRFKNNVEYPVNFTIQRNGELLAKKDSPYSWEELQSEFGKGMYKVIAKNALTGRMLKHESKSIAQPKVNEAKLEEKRASERDSVKDIINTVNSQFSESMRAVQESNNTQVQILVDSIKEEKLERRRLEEKQREELMDLRKSQNKEEAGTTTLLATLLPLLVNKKDDGGDKFMTMMLEIQKMNNENNKELQKQIMEVQKENREEARRSQEATSAMISRLVTELKPVEKKPEFDAISIMKMMQDSEAKGMEKMKEFMDLADERADRRVEEMTDKPDKEEGGVIQNTLKLLLPALISQGMNRPSAPAAAPEQRLIEQHRSSPPATPQARPIKKNVVTARVVPQKPVEATAATPVIKPIGVPVHTVNTAHAPKPATVVENGPKQDTITVESAKELIIQVATPILGEAFKQYLNDQSFDSVGTANDTVIALKKHGISAQLAVQVISAEDIIAVCHGYGLASAETDQHLRAYYDNIKKSVTA